MRVARRVPGEHSGGDPLDPYINELLRPPEHDLLVRRFREGKTWIRDIMVSTALEQRDIMQAGRKKFTGGQLSAGEDSSFAELARKKAEIFKIFMVGGERDETQERAGKNMFTEMARTYLPREDYAGISARWVQNVFVHEFGTGAGELAGLNEDQARAVWAQTAQKYPERVVWYLTERLKPAQEFQRDNFGEALSQAKRNVGALVGTLGLPQDVQGQVHERLELTTFSMFDHALGGVTFHDGSSYGDYIPGTLRVEIKMDGSPSQPTMPTQERAHQAVQHELLHAVSAQDADMNRSGLSIDNHPGLRVATEAMTEFLNQAIQGNVVNRGGRTVVTGDARGYAGIVPRVANLHNSDKEALDALVHTYFGSTEVNRVALKRGIQKVS